MRKRTPPAAFRLLGSGGRKELRCYAPAEEHAGGANQTAAEEHEAAGLRFAGIGAGAVHLRLGMTYAKLNDKTDAQAQLKKAMALAPNGKVGKVATDELVGM
jgi:hypothetical protein